MIFMQVSRMRLMPVHCNGNERMLTGYFQGVLLDKMYGRVATSKVIGKGFPRPIVKKRVFECRVKTRIIAGVSELSVLDRLRAGAIVRTFSRRYDKNSRTR